MNERRPTYRKQQMPGFASHPYVNKKGTAQTVPCSGQPEWPRRPNDSFISGLVNQKYNDEG